MKKIIIILFCIVVFNPFLVFAQDKKTEADTTTAGSKNFDIGLNYQGVDGSIRDYLCTPSEPADGKDLERCVGRLFRFGITAGALVLVFFVVIAGYLYLFSGESGKTKAKLYLKNSFAGMAVLLTSYLLLNFINPSLVMFKPIQPPIFDAKDLTNCEDLGFGEKCVGPEKGSGSGGGSGGGSTVSASELSNKKVYMFGDSLTNGFATQLKKEVSMSKFESLQKGGSTIEGWLNGGKSVQGPVPKISDVLKQKSEKPDVIIIMLGTNNARGGVNPESVKAMKDKLQGYSVIWIAPPKFTQPSCYKITHENSQSADNVISSNFTGSGFSVFKSAEKSIDLKLGKLNDCSAASGESGSGYEIHPGAPGYLNWVKAFLNKS